MNMWLWYICFFIFLTVVALWKSLIQGWGLIKAAKLYDIAFGIFVHILLDSNQQWLSWNLTSNIPTTLICLSYFSRLAHWFFFHEIVSWWKLNRKIFGSFCMCSICPNNTKSKPNALLRNYSTIIPISLYWFSLCVARHDFVVPFLCVISHQFFH